MYMYMKIYSRNSTFVEKEHSYCTCLEVVFVKIEPVCGPIDG